ncbi:hypothetical protein GCM10010280_11510 [Streptomyces pilosus]|uniref:Uncharacterized protein n=1 Tax=Streptomyces pilosus TaxID=28893 RepID=A0A918BGD4_9ACTN|nr:hypothetical protein GCM10010280_11510 [Streptomyces pilosus]
MGDQNVVGPQQDAQLSGSRVVGILDELGEDLQAVRRECFGAVQRALGHPTVDPTAATQSLIEEPDAARRFLRGRHPHFHGRVWVLQKRVYRRCESVHVRTPPPWCLVTSTRLGLGDGFPMTTWAQSSYVRAELRRALWFG